MNTHNSCRNHQKLAQERVKLTYVKYVSFSNMLRCSILMENCNSFLFLICRQCFQFSNGTVLTFFKFPLSFFRLQKSCSYSHKHKRWILNKHVTKKELYLSGKKHSNYYYYCHYYYYCYYYCFYYYCYYYNYYYTSYIIDKCKYKMIQIEVKSNI